MRLLSIIGSNIFSGPHNHDLRLNRALAQAGIETIVLLPDEPGDASERLRGKGMKVLEYPSNRTGGVASSAMAHAKYLAALRQNIRVVRCAIREFDIDLVQLADPFHPHGAFAAKLEKRPVVAHLIGMGGSLGARIMASQLTCRLADVLLTNGIKTRDAYPGLKKHPLRMFSYFSPIDMNEFRRDQAVRRKARSILGIRDDEIAIGYIARLNPEKDHHTCIRASAAIRRRFPHVRFIMMGGVHPGADGYLDDLRATASSLGLAFGKDVLHVDAGADVAKLAQAFDLAWSTGVQEGATSAVGEAMALGIPVIGTGNSAVREMIEHGVSGFLVGVRRPEELVNASIPLVENQILREKMGRAARQRAEDLFSTELCAATHLQAYETALSRRHGATGRNQDRDMAQGSAFLDS